MGRSVTCTFAVHTEISETSYEVTGAMSIKQAKGILASEIDFAKRNWRPIPKRAILWAQTAAGTKMLKGYDYIELLPNGKTNYCFIDKTVTA